MKDFWNQVLALKSNSKIIDFRAKLNVLISGLLVPDAARTQREYIVELTEVKLLNNPPSTVISSTVKFVVASLEVNINDNVG